MAIQKRFTRALKNSLPLDSHRTLIWHCLIYRWSRWCCARTRSHGRVVSIWMAATHSPHQPLSTPAPAETLLPTPPTPRPGKITTITKPQQRQKGRDGNLSAWKQLCRRKLYFHVTVVQPTGIQKKLHQYNDLEVIALIATLLVLWLAVWEVEDLYNDCTSDCMFVRRLMFFCNRCIYLLQCQRKGATHTQSR